MDVDTKETDVHSGHRARMRDRFNKYGFFGFAPHEALEVMLYPVVKRRDTNPIAHELINKYGSLRAVLRMPAHVLAKEKHIGTAGALLLNMLGRSGEMTAYLDSVDPIIKSPTQMNKLVRDLLVGRPFEELLVVCLDTKDRVTEHFSIYGGKDSIVITTRDLVHKVLNSGAHAVVVGHNHPGGNPMPSKQDLVSTDRLLQSLRGVGIKLYDHVIVANNSYYSFALNGLLKEKD